MTAKKKENLNKIVNSLSYRSEFKVRVYHNPEVKGIYTTLFIPFTVAALYLYHLIV